MFREYEQIYVEVLAEVTRHRTLQCAQKLLVRRMKERARKERRTARMRAGVSNFTSKKAGRKSGVSEEERVCLAEASGS